ncbi:PAS domain S-box protein, partial [Candidatus Bathyarchaeota archaeon]|nr:PAS domain S-box protein [Candidatus Bathyarchaeota archaeon]
MGNSGYFSCNMGRQPLNLLENPAWEHFMGKENSILIVDDEEKILETLKDVFEDMGFKVEVAATGNKALELIEENVYFDVNLIDYRLPDMDGLTLLKKVKKKNPDTIAIIITGNATLQNAIEALKDGVDAYFVKPIILEDVLHKITQSLEKKRLQKEIEISEERFRLIFENASDLVAVLNENRVYEYVNKNQVAMLGYTEDEFIGQEAVKFMHPEDIQEKAFLEGVREKEITGEFRIRHKDGHYIWFEIKATTFTTKASNRKILMLSRNIMKRKQAENKILKSENKYRNLVNNLSESVIQIKPDGTVIYASPQIFDLTGYYPNEIIGENAFEIIHEDDLGFLKQDIVDSIKNDRKFVNEFRVFHADRSIRTVSVTGVSVENEDETGKEYTAMNCIMRDITKQLAAENERRRLYEKIKKMNLELEEKIKQRTRELEDTLSALKESQARLRAILENSPTVIYLKDMDAKYLLVNHQFEVMFNVKNELVIGKRDPELFDESIVNLFSAHEKQVIEYNAPMEFEEDIFHDGWLHTYLSIKFPINEPDGKPYAICSLSTDITERKWAEEAIKENELRFRTIFNSVSDGMYLVNPESEKFYLVN